jgi:type II secretory pathway pseudopilin PulG
MSLMKSSCRAFTLTEVAITLGVVGTVLSGIWWAASEVYYSMEVNKTLKTVRQLSESTKAFYSNRPPTNLTTDQRYVTEALGLARAYPLELNFANNLFEHSPNSGPAYFVSVRLDTGIPTYLISIHRITPDMCTRLATNLIKAPDSRAWPIWLNGTAAPQTENDIDRLCYAQPAAGCWFGQPCLIAGYRF